MKPSLRIALEETILGIVFLTGCWYVYYTVAIWGLLDHLTDGPLKTYVTGPGVHVEMLVSAVGFGVLLTGANRIAEKPALRQKPVWLIILVRGGLYLSSLAMMVVVVHVIFFLFLFTPEEIGVLWRAFSYRLLISLATVMILSFLSLAFLLEVRSKVGPGNLWSLLTGRYHRPREEDRVFLFLDLKGSTAIAEQLGHAQYSQFIRQCFHDLTEFVLSFQAQIYQFVGDEVVLTWPHGGPYAEKKSLEVFFSFQDRLATRRDWYLDRFGVAPEFRAGVEGGSVTATEVGDIKREIAFHGDALNTAARLLELCREYDAPVLVSGKIQAALDAAPRWSTRLRAEIKLRGKMEPVRVYGVERAAMA